MIDKVYYSLLFHHFLLFSPNMIFPIKALKIAQLFISMHCGKNIFSKCYGFYFYRISEFDFIFAYLGFHATACKLKVKKC